MKSRLFGAICIFLLSITSANAVIVFSQPVIDGEPIYGCGACAESFVLGH